MRHRDAKRRNGKSDSLKFEAPRGLGVAVAGLISLIISIEAVLIIILMAFNAYFLAQRPILHYIKEIYFINSLGFRQAWYLVISATTFFLLIQVMGLLGDVGVVIPATRAEMGGTIFTLAFGTLIILAFAITFRIFLRYVRRLPASEKEIYDLIGDDMRRAVMADDRTLNINVDLSKVGDVMTERRQLGPYVSLSHYRALTTGFMAYMEHKLGHMGDAILYAVGRLAGKRAAADILRDAPSVEVAREDMFREIRQNGIGIPEVRQETQDRVDVAIHENAPAAGIKRIGRTVCHYQAGMLAGIFEELTGKPTLAKETKCWGLGDRLCEFRVDLGVS